MGVSAEQGIGSTGIWLGDHLPHRYSPDLVNAVLAILPAPPQTVRDLGCGTGKYLAELLARGCTVEGVEGTPYVATSDVTAYVRTADLTQPLGLTPVDLTLCIEVGEHIPAVFMHDFIANVTASVGRWLVLSWAIPGQTGYGHVNCLDNTQVMALLDLRGLRFDASRTQRLRHLLRNDCCRYLPNTLLVFEKP